MKVPRKHSDILAKNYIKYMEYLKTEPKDEKEIIKNTILIFYDIKEDKFNSFEYKIVLDMYKIIENILKIPQKLIPIFTFKGIEYGINPNFDDMTFAEMVDCDTTDIIQQICVLYRPIKKKKGDKYTIKKYKADISIYEDMKETLTLDVFLGFLGFFLKINSDILNYTLNYLMEKATDPEMKKLLEKNGVGWDGYMNYAGVI